MSDITVSYKLEIIKDAVPFHNAQITNQEISGRKTSRYLIVSFIVPDPSRPALLVVEGHASHQFGFLVFDRHLKQLPVSEKQSFCLGAGDVPYLSLEELRRRYPWIRILDQELCFNNLTKQFKVMGLWREIVSSGYPWVRKQQLIEELKNIILR